MGTDSIHTLLAGWREAERSWEESPPGEDSRAAAARVLDAWLKYQEVALSAQPDEFLLVADDDQTYVAATSGVRVTLGYEPAEMVGRRIADFASADLRDATPSQWADFVAAGRQDGHFTLRTKGGRDVALNFQARAHHPIAGFHVSRLWPDPADAARPGA
jgi:hypothetical protein